MNIGWRSLLRKRHRSLHFYQPFYLPVRSYAEDVFESPTQLVADLRRNAQSESQTDSSQTDKLAYLIKKGHHRMAQATRDELLNDGKDIRWDDSFFEAAHYALGDSAHEGSLSSFTKWLRLLPDASRRSREQHESFRRLHDALVKQGQPRTDFIHQFAVVLASKGYREYVEDHLLPIVREHGFGDMFLDLKFQLLPTKLSSTQSSDVFETEDDEYSASYVETPEYGIQQDGHLVARQLLHCLEKGSYNEARTILLELESVNHPITPDKLFEAGAIMALEMHSQEKEIAHEEFILFLSHVPPFHMQPPESTMPFLETIHRIIHDHRTLLKRLALVLASKGYAPLLSPLLLPTILRMNQPEPARLFLREYERLDEKYQWERPPGVSELRLVAPEMRVAISLKAIRESAVRVLTDLGQLDFAFGLISSDDTREIRLNRRTYGHLLAALEKRRAYLVGQDVFSSKKLTKLDALMTKVQLMRDEASDQALPLAGLETQMPLVHTITTTTQLVEAIRLVKAALPFNTGRREDKRRLDGPTIVQILAVLSSPETVLTNDSGYREHVAASRPNLLRLLRRRALLSTERSTKIWLFSEMVHLWHLRRYEEIVKLFEVHFWCYGVPITEIARIANAMPDPWDHRWVRDLFRGIPEKGILPKPKFYPTAYHHTSIVWQSLVMTHEDNKGKIASLYRTMVQYARAYQEASKQLHEDSEESELDAPYKTPIGLDSDSDSSAFPIISQENPLICVENFTPFIRQLSAGGSRPDLQRSDLDPTQIMRDMMNLKMRPTTHQFTELARRYVLNSDGPRALKILDHLEVINFQEPPLRTADDTAANPSRARDSSLPEPDIICYIALMRAFLRMNDLEGVEEVDRRLKIRYGSLEELLAGLEKRKQTERVKEDVITINEVYRDWELLEAWNSKNVEGAPVMAV